ncbi:MAG TPA: cytochrome c biogenesis protein ResB [Solirubrobacterales bacterium]|nr:cytochrome c biogenesis protein ResB [Solirubrobacterales bacterium]
MAAVGERVGAAVGKPARRRLWQTARRTWFAFTSVRSANVLLAAMLVAGLVGILVVQFGTSTLADPALRAAAVERLPDRYGRPLAGLIERLELYRVFTTSWWTLLVALFTVSVVGNTLSRLPRLLRDVRTPAVKRGRAFFRSSVPARTGPLEGLDGSVLPDLLRGMGYRVRLERAGSTTHLLAERNRLAPLASIASHASLLLFVIGMGIVTPRFGYETALKVPVGEGRPTGFPDDPQTVLVQNEAFVAQFDPTGSPLDYRTTLAVYRRGEQIARKEITVNDPLSIDGWAFHENFFGPAVELDVRGKTGLVLYSGSVLLDGNLGGKPEGLLAVPGTDVSLELLLAKGAGGVAELTVIGARAPTGNQVGPQIVFGAVLTTGDGYFAPDPGIGVEFRRPSSYIGLIAKRDPGQGFIWLGAILLVAGVSVSLLRPRRRVWARYDGSVVRLAVVAGDPFAEEECESLVASLPALDAGLGDSTTTSGHA